MHLLEKKQLDKQEKNIISLQHLVPQKSYCTKKNHNNNNNNNNKLLLELPNKRPCTWTSHLRMR